MEMRTRGGFLKTGRRRVGVARRLSRVFGSGLMLVLVLVLVLVPGKKLSENHREEGEKGICGEKK
jgi:hypothetical protein